MRFYDISVTNSSGAQVKHWTSHPNSNMQPPDPGALKVEIDCFNVGQGVPLPGSFVRVWGISLDDIGRASDLNGCDLVLNGGMGKGLPLANPAQAGVLIQGHIQQAFANWIGTTMTLDMILVAGTIASGTGSAQNVVVNWPKNTTMGSMLNNLLGTLFPNATLDINVSPNLVLPYNERHFVGTLPQLATYLIEASRRIMNTGPSLAGFWNNVNNSLSTYPGVQLVVDGSTIRAYDGTTAQTPKQISINDLVGQPTWIGPQTIQATLVMRGDIRVGDFVQLPPTRAIVTSASLSPYSQQRQDILFQGTFLVNQVRHVGNYKDTGPLAWVTVIDAAVQTTTNSSGQSIVNLGLSGGQPSQPQPAGQFGNVTIESIDIDAAGNQTTTPAVPATASAAGLAGASAASVGFATLTPATAASSDEFVEPPATASSVGLVQSAPAPSLGQSVQDPGGF